MRVADMFEINAALDDAIRKKCGVGAADLLERIRQIDDQLIAEGVDPGSRHVRAGLPLTIEYNITIFGDRSDPVEYLLDGYFRVVYGQENLAIGPFHVGALMVRDIFFEIHVPMIFGTVKLDPWEFVKGDRSRLNILCSMSPGDASIGTDQLIDVFDFAYAVDDHSKITDGRSSELLFLAKEQMDAACRTLLGSFSKRIAIQGTAYAVEMAGKAILLSSGIDEKALREKFGHNLSKIYRAVTETGFNIDTDRVLLSIGNIPNVVGERYNFGGIDRQKIGGIIRHGQFVLGEVGRAISNRNLRGAVSPEPVRVFPPGGGTIRG